MQDRGYSNTWIMKEVRVVNTDRPDGYDVIGDIHGHGDGYVQPGKREGCYG